MNDETSPLSHAILWVSAVFIIIMLTWASVAKLDEVTSGEGTVIPSSKVQIIQNLEGGIIQKILVREGDVVKKNQILMHIDDTQFGANVKEQAQAIDALIIKIARLDAVLYKKPFKINKKLINRQSSLYQTEESLYQSSKQQMQNLKTSYNLVNKELTMTAPLVKKGVVSEVELLKLKRQVNELKTNLTDFRTKALDELNKSKAELAKLQEKQKGLQDRVARTSVRSPVDGTVKELKISTIGGVVTPGMEIIEIVPLNDTLLIEAQVRPQDIGFLRPGQEAMIKLSAYDYSIYGGLPAKVEHISADTIMDDEGNRFYKIKVRTNKTYIEKNGEKLGIIPGMVATVDILTGSKTVMDYLLKPILKAKNTALRER